jgi:hypothetical protein
MKREIKIFKSFEEQEEYFNSYFYNLTPSERLQALNRIQLLNSEKQPEKTKRKITLRKHFGNGY